MDNQPPNSSDTTAAAVGGMKPKRRRFSMRGFTSLLLTLSMLVMAFAGVMLYLTPRGRVANWTDWTLVGLGKEQWASLHMNASLLFVIVAVLHLVLNWSIFFSYLKKKSAAGLHQKKELALATLIALVCVVGTINELPPFNSVAALNHEIKDYWEQRVTRAPIPHAEELTLLEFATQVNLPVDDLTTALGQEGFDAVDIQLTVGELGRRNGVAPSAVLAAVQKHHPQAGAMTGGGPGRGRGQGFGQGRAVQSQCESSRDTQGEDSCSNNSGGRDSHSDSECSADSEEEHGLGEGHGLGRGQGQGRGMGMGMGLGRGMGYGRGEHSEHGDQSTDQQEAADK